MRHIRYVAVMVMLWSGFLCPARADEGAPASAPAAPAASAPASGDALKPGVILDKSNWQLADGLLPPEILKHYREGEYVNPIVDWPNGLLKFDDDFIAATEKNVGQLDVDALGGIVYKGTNKQPPYIFGFPFPVIDPQDPNAGVKVLWNHYYVTWYIGGNTHTQVALNWIRPDGLDRTAGQDVNFLRYDGQPERYRMNNPENFDMQFLANAMSPTDLYGTASLTWRYRDSDKRDSDWVYVPALRRVRAVSPANRSDGFLGSDMSQDDGPFFDGKPADFTWKLVGEREQLRIVDPLSLQGKSVSVWLPSGGWRARWPADLKSLGYLDPNWKGYGWAPIAAALAKRPVWVIEGIPKDKYYLYGKIELYIDKENYQGAWNRKFSWSGELLNTLQVMGYLYNPVTRPDGVTERVQGSSQAYQCAENIKMNRATTGGTLAPLKDPAVDVRVPYEASFFDMNTLSRFGK